MGFIQRWFNSDTSSVEYRDFLDAIIVGAEDDIQNDFEDRFIHKMATKLSTAVIVTYESNHVVKKNNWHLWNVSPNQNQTISEFLYRLFAKLLKEGQALVVPLSDAQGKFIGHFIADTCDINDLTAVERIFSNIIIKDYKIREVKRESQVIFMQFDRTPINEFNTKVRTQLNPMIHQMVKYGRKQHANKFLLKLNTTQNMMKEDKEKITADVRKFLDATTDSALPISGIVQEFKPIDASTTNKTGSVVENIMKLDKYIEEETGLLFGIPPIRSEDKAEDIDAHLVMACRPYAKMLEDQLKAKLYTQEGMKKGDFCRVIIPSRLLDAELDTKIHTGLYSINDALHHSGREGIDASWADLHWMTKNYATIESMIENKNPERKEDEE